MIHSEVSSKTFFCTYVQFSLTVLVHASLHFLGISRNQNGCRRRSGPVHFQTSPSNKTRSSSRKPSAVLELFSELKTLLGFFIVVCILIGVFMQRNIRYQLSYCHDLFMIVFNGNRFNKFSLTIQSLNRTSIY